MKNNRTQKFKHIWLTRANPVDGTPETVCTKCLLERRLAAIVVSGESPWRYVRSRIVGGYKTELRRYVSSPICHGRAIVYLSIRKRRRQRHQEAA